MKISRTCLLFAVASLFFISCSDDDGFGGANPGNNEAPGTFALTSVEDGAVDVDVKPTLIWGASTDPDGDIVTYDLYVGTENDLQTLVAENLDATAYTLPERLSLTTNYHWKVIAKDSKDNQTQSEGVFGFSTRNITAGTLATQILPGFSKRESHTTVVFDGKIWVIGGEDELGNLKNDVWYSSDGTSWTKATPDAGFSPRYRHTSIVFDDKIWVIGGESGTGAHLNDVWFSSDGTIWQQATANAGFTKRRSHKSVVFKGKIWVIGGIDDPEGWVTDVWSSSDGVTWTKILDTTGFDDRILSSSVVFDNKIWIIGGGNPEGEYNDVWYSSDGENWVQATANAGFSERLAHASVVFDHKIWVIGGDEGWDELQNDVWYSKNGVDWQQAIYNAGFPKRSNHTAVTKDGKIWIIGGRGSTGSLNDVWYLD